jgi:hypothetical protein
MSTNRLFADLMEDDDDDSRDDDAPEQPQVEAPPANPKPAPVDAWHLRYESRDEESYARKRALCAKIREIESKLEPAERVHEIESAAEATAHIRLVRNSLERWAEQEPYIGHWKVRNFEDGTSWLELSIPGKNGSGGEPRVFVRISYED